MAINRIVITQHLPLILEYSTYILFFVLEKIV